jgi:hypothetical protein
MNNVRIDDEQRQNGAEKVDGTVDSGVSSRARAHTGEIAPELEVFAKSIEADSQLPPSAGIREIVLASPSLRKQVVAAAVRCLGATKWYYSTSQKKHVYDPDYATQLKAAAWLASYSDGLPAQTNLNINANAGAAPQVSPEDMLAASPAAREAMRRALARADEKAALASTRPQKSITQSET